MKVDEWSLIALVIDRQRVIVFEEWTKFYCVKAFDEHPEFSV